MSSTIRFARSGTLQWPAACAKCQRTDGLTVADATSGRVTSVSPTLTGAVRVKSELLDLRYPVCEGHSKGLAAANFVTRNTSGLRAVRVFLYCFGPPSIISLLRQLIPGIPNVRLSFDLAGLFAACAAGFIYVLFAFRKLPVRVVKLTEDELSIRFANANYAAAFERLNAGLKRP